MHRLFTFTAALALTTGAASAGQPIYKSMVECSAIYAASAELVRSTPRKQRLGTASKVWRTAAVDAVNAARMPDAASYVAMMHGEKLRQWRGKGNRVAFTREYREWAYFCQSLAGARKLDLAAK
jgi:hypothetical protein